VGARVAVVVVAFAVLGWLVVQERGVRLQAHGLAAAGSQQVAGNFARAESDFRGARLLSPDATPDISRAVLYYGAGRRSAAAALLEDVLRREPDDLTAWGVLFQVTNGHDPAAAARALAMRRRLDPVGARLH
jgi:predicted Zn-dependent protease